MHSYLLELVSVVLPLWAFLPAAKAAQTDEFFIEIRLFFYKKNRRLTDERLHVQLGRIALEGQQMAQALIAVRERINASVV